MVGCRELGRPPFGFAGEEQIRGLSQKKTGKKSRILYLYAPVLKNLERLFFLSKELPGTLLSI